MKRFGKRRFARHRSLFTDMDLAIFFVMAALLVGTFCSSVRKPPARTIHPMVVEVVECDRSPAEDLLFGFREDPTLPPLDEPPESDARRDALRPVDLRLAEGPFTEQIHAVDITSSLGTIPGEAILDPAPPLFSKPVAPDPTFRPKAPVQRAETLVFSSEQAPLPIVLIDAPTWTPEEILAQERALVDKRRSTTPTNAIAREPLPTGP